VESGPKIGPATVVRIGGTRIRGQLVPSVVSCARGTGNRKSNTVVSGRPARPRQPEKKLRCRSALESMLSGNLEQILRGFIVLKIVISGGQELKI
jgi:hypothetical protein